MNLRHIQATKYTMSTMFMSSCLHIKKSSMSMLLHKNFSMTILAYKNFSVSTLAYKKLVNPLPQLLLGFTLS